MREKDYEYKVRWVDTWLPRSELGNAQQLLRLSQAQRRARRSRWGTLRKRTGSRFAGGWTSLRSADGLNGLLLKGKAHHLSTTYWKSRTRQLRDCFCVHEV